MYLVRGQEVCAECGTTELAEWNKLMEESNERMMTPEEKRRASAAASVLALCLVLGLVACGNDDGGEQVNSQGVQTCAVEVNGQVKPCH
jgi:MoaA/NifB/PqqE/SkfB family radical SAM enzyme